MSKQNPPIPWPYCHTLKLDGIPWRPFEMVTLTPDLPAYFPDTPPGIDCMRETQDAIWRAMSSSRISRRCSEMFPPSHPNCRCITPKKDEPKR